MTVTILELYPQCPVQARSSLMGWELFEYKVLYESESDESDPHTSEYRNSDRVYCLLFDLSEGKKTKTLSSQHCCHYLKWSIMVYKAGLYTVLFWRCSSTRTERWQKSVRRRQTVSVSGLEGLSFQRDPFPLIWSFKCPEILLSTF